MWQDILNNGFARIPMPLPKSVWSRLYTTFDEFSASLDDDPDAIKSFDTEAKNWQATSGLSKFFGGYFSPYYRDTTKQEGKDKKRIVQLCEPYYRYLYDRNSSLLANKFYREMLDSLMAAMYASCAAIRPLLQELKDVDEQVYNALIPDSSLPPVAIRLLSYDADSVLATNPHVDKSAITVIVDTDDSPDDPKLVFGEPEPPGGVWKLSQFKPFPKDANESIAFLGAALKQAGHTRFRSLPHAVRPFTATAVRHSAVFFWLLPNFDMAKFDTKVPCEDDLGLARPMAPKKAVVGREGRRGALSQPIYVVGVCGSDQTVNDGWKLAGRLVRAGRSRQQTVGPSHT